MGDEDFERDCERGFQSLKNKFAACCFMLAAKNGRPFWEALDIVNGFSDGLGLDEAVKAAYELDDEFARGEKPWLVWQMFGGSIEPPAPKVRW